VNPQDREAILEAVAAVIDAGEPVDWAQAERDLDDEGRETLGALRVVAEIRARRWEQGRGIESARVTEFPAPAPETPPPSDPPVSDRFRSREPSTPEQIRRKLLFGVALVLALLSLYAGLFGWQMARYLLSGLAAATALIALLTGAGRPRPPRPPGAAS
jgi:hypothetical protein